MASRPLRSDPAAVVALLSGPGRSDFAQFLARQRWFAAKTRGVGTLAVRDWAILDAEGPLVLLLLDVDGDRYHVPVTVAADAPAGAPPRQAPALAGEFGGAPRKPPPATPAAGGVPRHPVAGTRWIGGAAR